MATSNSGTAKAMKRKVRPWAFFFCESTCNCCDADTARARAALSPARTAIVLLRAWVMLDRDDAEALGAAWFFPAGGRIREMPEEPLVVAACANEPEPCVGDEEGFDEESGDVIGLSEEPDGERGE